MFGREPEREGVRSIMAAEDGVGSRGELVDAARMAMIIAILERRAGMSLGGHDVYCSVAGACA